MKTQRNEDVRDARGTISQKPMAKVDTVIAEEVCSCRELRQALGISQRKLAKLTKMTQTELAKFEMRDDHRLERVSDVVHALGGKLELVAVVGDKRVRVALLDVETFPDASAWQELMDLTRAMKAP